MDRPLTARGEPLPSEYVGADGYPRELGTAVRYLASDVADGPTTLAFEEGGGQQFTVESHSRFTEEYARERYGRLKELDRTLMDEYTNPHTVMITLGGTCRNADGGWRAPVDHAKDLRASRDAVRQAIHRACGEMAHEIVTVYGYHDSGYLHAHLGVYVDGPVSQSDFEPVIDAHTRNSPVAKASHHPYDDAVTIRSHRDTERVNDDGDGYESHLSTYLGGNIVGIDGDVTAGDDDAPLIAAVTLNAAGINMISLPRGWKRRLGVDDGDDGEYRYLGVVDGQGRVIDVGDEGGATGNERVQPKSLPDDVDPTDHLDAGDRVGGVG